MAIDFQPNAQNNTQPSSKKIDFVPNEKNLQPPSKLRLIKFVRMWRISRDINMGMFGRSN